MLAGVVITLYRTVGAADWQLSSACSNVVGSMVGRAQREVSRCRHPKTKGTKPIKSRDFNARIDRAQIQIRPLSSQ
jgi:hypothetical protein